MKMIIVESSYSSLIPGSPRSKAHKTRIINCNHETGTRKDRHHKVKPTNDSGKKNNFEKTRLEILTQ